MSSKKIAARTYPSTSPALEKLPHVVVRKYDETRDKAAVDDLERRCEVGQPGQLALVTDLMGDPIARVRNFSAHIMLVAEYGDAREVAGVIRGCIKTVTTGKTRSRTQFPDYVKLAYILGLRVSSRHRRLGIAAKLVEKLEGWSRQNGAEYAYMATECDNQPSLNLFTQKCNYVKFRNPTVLVQPVHLHRKPLPSDVAITQIPPILAAAIYRRLFSSSEFFPEDISGLLNNKHSLGTFMALPEKSLPDWRPEAGVLPASFAVLSVWNAKEVYRLQVKGVSALKQTACLGTRVADAALPWLKIPSVPDFSRTFGFCFMYGLHMEGEDGSRLMRSLCRFVHNMGRDDGECRAVVAEVGKRDPVREGIPHWKKFSWDEDVWCIKNLGEGKFDEWFRSPAPSSVMFVDPRDL